uniref:Uncharacterized protein n=1 Tax=Cucumis melo TaxID=3656 RepID=A0A9I9E5W3_CUCME
MGCYFTGFSNLVVLELGIEGENPVLRSNIKSIRFIITNNGLGHDVAGLSVMEYEEHEKRAWSVDFSRSKPSMLVSSSDDFKLHCSFSFNRSKFGAQDIRKLLTSN